MAQRAAYTITYTSQKARELDDDFVMLCIEAHSYDDAMQIVQNIERYFDGVTITCQENDDETPKKHVGRRPQRAKAVCNR